MKYFLLTLLILLFILSGCLILGASFADTSGCEFFEGTAQGYRGPITVQVLMRGNHIIDIFIIDSREDSFIGSAAIDELVDMVIMYNSTDLDAVSGATISSKGFLEAVENAIMGR